MGFESEQSIYFLEEKPPVEYTLDDIYQSIKGDTECEDYYHDVEKASRRYLDSVLTEGRLAHDTLPAASQDVRESGYVGELERQGQSRTSAHNNVVFTTGVLARLAKEAGRDTSWWSGENGLSLDEAGNPVDDIAALQKDKRYCDIRSRIGLWALQQATNLLHKEAEEEVKKHYGQQP